MEQTKIDMFIAANRRFFSDDKIGIIRSQLEKVDDKKFLAVQSANYTNTVKLLIVSILLGYLGIDRFMLGHTGLGIIKLLTLGGYGIWWIVDWFLIVKSAKEKNFFIFTQVAN